MLREVLSSCFARMHVRMYVLLAGLYVCMSARVVVVVKSVAVVNPLTAVELGLAEVEDGPRGAIFGSDPSNRSV